MISQVFRPVEAEKRRTLPLFFNQNSSAMNITFDELREIKHKLPTGSVSRIAQELNLQEQTVRNYFGAHKYEDGEIVDAHIQPGPHGGIVHLEDTRILEAAMKILSELELEEQKE